MGRGGEVQGLLAERVSAQHLRLLRTVGELAEKAGAGAFLVGGTVRDMFVQRGHWAALDIDIAVEGPAGEVAAAVAEAVGGLLAAQHDRFGTCRVTLPEGGHADFAATRAETYSSPAALPDVRPAPLREDLLRRDFSVNAMAVALNPRSFGELVDPCGGRAGIEARVIRVLHDGSIRDDPTRAFRAVRFAQRLGFRIEEATLAQMAAALSEGLFELLSGERLRNEVELLLREDTASACVREAARLGLLGVLGADVRLSKARDRLLARAQRRRAVLEEAGLPSEAQWVVQLGCLLHGLSRGELGAVMERLAMPAGPRDAVKWALEREGPVLYAVQQSRPSEKARVLRDAPVESAAMLAVFAPEDEVAQSVVHWAQAARTIAADVNGDDLIALGHKPGPAFREALDAALAAKLDGAARTKEEQLDVARRVLSRQDGGPCADRDR